MPSELPSSASASPSGDSQPGRRGYSRSHYRSASHASAHAAGAAPAPVPEHPLIPGGSAELITDDAALAKLLDALRRTGSFAYDSEFIGEASYLPKLCLIQVATAEHLWLIDPLAGVQLRPFWQLLCDPSVRKIVHAGEQDIEPVVRHLDTTPANFFDTQIAAGMSGLVYPLSLSKLVLELTGAKLGKGLTFTHWDQRPLSPMQMRYAADDVRYLPAVQAALTERLTALGHAGWLREECDAMCEPSRYKFDPAAATARVRGAGSLAGPNLAVLRELVSWRNDAAREADLPPRAYLRDEVLISLAREPVKSADRLGRVRGLPRPVENQWSARIVAITLKALAEAGPSSEPRAIEPTPRQRFAADALWAAAQCLAAARQIDPALVANRQDIADFYEAAAGPDATKPDPTKPDPTKPDRAKLQNLRIMRGWRRAAVGDDLIKLLGGEKQFTLSWRDGSLADP